jgi:DNA polymerase III epsilon subunit-like protein
MNYETRKANREKAIEAAKQLIDILRPIAHDTAEQLRDIEFIKNRALKEWGEAFDNDNKEAQKEANDSLSLWREMYDQRENELQAIDDAILFAKRLIPGKQY